MSEFGPTMVITRRDGAAIGVAEQAEILRLVTTAARSLGLTDDGLQDGTDRPVSPEVLDADARSVQVALYSTHVFKVMPSELFEDYIADWVDTAGPRLAAGIDELAAGVYLFEPLFEEC